MCEKLRISQFLTEATEWTQPTIHFGNGPVQTVRRQMQTMHTYMRIQRNGDTTSERTEEVSLVTTAASQVFTPDPADGNTAVDV